jgi:APA family basic amino acid/polyamine antiporter
MTENNVLMDIGGWLKIYPAQLVSIALIVVLTWINTRGVKEGKAIQTFFTSVKILSLAALIIFGLILAADSDIWSANFANGFDLSSTQAVRDADGSLTGWSLFESPLTTVLAIGIISSAMVGSVFSSVAWENVTFIAGEIKNPQRNVGLSLFLGTLIVTVIYILTNIMYVAVLPITPEAMEGSVAYAPSSASIAFAPEDRVGTAVSGEIFGSYGAVIIAIMIMISTFGCNNGLILTGARLCYTMAKDRLFLPKAGILNKNAVPGWALWAQCIWASVLCLSGKYGLLLDYVVFITLIFYILTIWGIFRLRKSRPNAERPYKAFGYPVIPVIYMLMAGTMALGLLYIKWQTSLLGILIVLLGIPLYYVAQRRMK